MSTQEPDTIKVQPQPPIQTWTELQPTEAGFYWAMARDGEVEMIEVLEWGKARTMYSHDPEGFALSCWTLFMEARKPEKPLDPSIQAHLDNGDPRCHECGSFQVESKKDILFQKGKPHREENSETVYFYECECGHQFEG